MADIANIPGPDDSGNIPGSGSLVGAAADWDITKVRYFLIDYDGGNDNFQGYIDAAAGSTLTPTNVAFKTIEKFHQVFPRYGNGRVAVVLIKNRSAGATYLKQDAVTEDGFDFTGVTGYRRFYKRGSTDLTNSASDRITCGAITALAGPGGSGEWTCAAGATTSVFSVSSGTLTAEPGIVGYRVRFTGNITAGLANVCAFISANTSSAITVGTNITAPATGDTFFIEGPGVRIASYQEIDSMSVRSAFGSSNGSNFINQTAGLCVTGSGSSMFGVGANENAGYVFCEQNTATTNIVLVNRGGRVNFLETYFDEANTSRTVGGNRFNCGVSLNLNERVIFGSSACVHATAPVTLVGFDTITAGNGGSYFANSPQVQGGASSSTCDFGNVGASTVRRTRIVGGSGLGAFVKSMWIRGVDFTNQTGACIKLGNSTSSVQDMSEVRIDDVVGSSGNTDVGVDVSNARGAQVVVGTVAAVTVTGSSGDIRVAGPTVITHADLANACAVDKNRNTVMGSAGMSSKGADVASAGTLAILNGDFFFITGTTNIDYINVGYRPPGATLTLKFGASLTLNHNTGTVPAGAAALFLDGSANVSATANDMIDFKYDGTLWRQRSRILGV